MRWRDANGAFRNRQQLLDVTGLGPKTFEQAAGFLRIRDGDNPLDLTGVHPETYPLVQRMLAAAGRPVHELMGRADVLRALKPEAFADERFGAITVKDILAELEKPGRDPRPDFKVARFNDGVEDIKDLQPGHGARRHGQQRRAVRRLRRPRRAPGRAGARQPAGQQVRQRCARGRQDRRHRQGARARGRPGAQAHLADDEARRARRAQRRRARPTTVFARRRVANGRARPSLRARALWVRLSPGCKVGVDDPVALMSSAGPRAWVRAARSHDHQDCFGQTRQAMKTLFLVRHAKSSWDDPTLADLGRPEPAARGAATMGQRLSQRHVRPDLIVSSPAVAPCPQRKFPRRSILGGAGRILAGFMT